MNSNCHDFDPEHASGLCIPHDALPHHIRQPSSAEELSLGKKCLFVSHGLTSLTSLTSLTAPVVTPCSSIFFFWAHGWSTHLCSSCFALWLEEIHCQGPNTIKSNKPEPNDPTEVTEVSQMPSLAGKMFLDPESMK